MRWLGQSWHGRLARAFERSGRAARAWARRPCHVWLLAVLALLSIAAAPTAPDDLPPTPSATTRAVRFRFVDLTIDPKSTPLSAYQLEFVADPARVKLVGVEGGDHPAYATPPYYDPAALQQSRVILAALNTGADLPKRPFRAARLHLQITGTEPLEPQVTLIVASAADGTSIPAAVTITEGAEQ